MATEVRAIAVLREIESLMWGNGNAKPPQFSEVILYGRTTQEADALMKRLRRACADEQPFELLDQFAGLPKRLADFLRNPEEQKRFGWLIHKGTISSLYQRAEIALLDWECIEASQAVHEAITRANISLTTPFVDDPDAVSRLIVRLKTVTSADEVNLDPRSYEIADKPTTLQVLLGLGRIYAELSQWIYGQSGMFLPDWLSGHEPLQARMQSLNEAVAEALLTQAFSDEFGREFTLSEVEQLVSYATGNWPRLKTLIDQAGIFRSLQS